MLLVLTKCHERYVFDRHHDLATLLGGVVRVVDCKCLRFESEAATDQASNFISLSKLVEVGDWFGIGPVALVVSVFYVLLPIYGIY